MVKKNNREALLTYLALGGGLSESDKEYDSSEEEDNDMSDIEYDEKQGGFSDSGSDNDGDMTGSDAPPVSESSGSDSDGEGTGYAKNVNSAPLTESEKAAEAKDIKIANLIDIMMMEGKTDDKNTFLKHLRIPINDECKKTELMYSLEKLSRPNKDDRGLGHNSNRAYEKLVKSH